MNTWTYEHMRYFPCPKGKEDKLKEAMISGEYFAQRKWDGASFIFSKDENGEIGLFSRQTSKKTGFFSEKAENVPHIIDQLKYLPNKTMLIGEIAYPDGISSDTTTIMGCLPPKAQMRNKAKPIHYYVFDLLWYDGIDYTSKPAEERIFKLEDVLAEHESDTLHLVLPIFEDIPEHLALILATGGEGIVLKHKQKPYDTNGKRPAWHTIKVKTIDSADVVIMDIQLPTSTYTGKDAESYEFKDADGNAINRLYALGMINAFIIGAYDDEGKLQKIGRVASGLNDEIRLAAAQNPDDFIGSVIEVVVMSKDSAAKTLRHPRLLRRRFDKNAEECIISEIF